MNPRWLIVGAFALACAANPEPEPAQFSPQLASDRSLVVGGVLSKEVDPRGVRVVIVDRAGRPYHVLVLRLTRAGMTLETGDDVTAWCHGAGDDLVADSMRVDKHRRKHEEPEPQPPAMPPQEQL